MYEAFFGLSRRPFTAAPDPGRYFPAEAIETARGNLFRCLQRGEGTSMVVGPSGTGKTLLCQVLAEQLRPTLPVVHLGSGRLGSHSALYQAILHGLGRRYRGMDDGELRLALVDYLTAGDHGPGALALLVDEAHTLPLRLLDEVRMLTNLACSGEPRVRVMLAGGPTLEERLASPKLESFSQRIVARCYLESFSRTETEQYIPAQIKAAGGDPARLFTAEAAAAVYQATDGVPRLINQLCDHALVLAFADGDAAVDAASVETAWADLQQLPTPWTGRETGDAAPPDVIEFGGLEDESPGGEESALAEPASPAPLVAWAEPEVELVFEEPSADSQAPSPQTTPSPGPVLDAFDDEAAIAGATGPSGSFDEPFEEEEQIVQRYPGAEAWAAAPRASTTPSGAEPERWSSRIEPGPGALGGDVHGRRVAEGLIVVEDEEESHESADVLPAATARESRYRNLFARLRQQ